MRDLPAVLASVLIFVVGQAGLAKDQDVTAALVSACDRAAASPTDEDRPIGLGDKQK
jgi:hypothetical protein